MAGVHNVAMIVVRGDNNQHHWAGSDPQLDVCGLVLIINCHDSCRQPMPTLGFEEVIVPKAENPNNHGLLFKKADQGVTFANMKRKECGTRSDSGLRVSFHVSSGGSGV